MMFCDTPGYVDFFGQVISASRATETGMIVIDAAAGIQGDGGGGDHRGGNDP